MTYIAFINQVQAHVQITITIQRYKKQQEKGLRSSSTKLYISILVGQWWTGESEYTYLVNMIFVILIETFIVHIPTYIED